MVNCYHTHHKKYNKHSLKTANYAFSLVELSIVLVILGLLVGGIMTGQNLIHAAELRSVSKDIGKYQTAIYTFRDKYRALPGDMPNAVRFWGAQAGGTADGRDATCAGLDETSPATGAPTCNGDGNGRISGWEGIAGTTRYEAFRIWQHLANAGMIEGNYIGVRSSPSIEHGTNIPAAKIGQAGFHLIFLGSASGSAAGTPGSYFYDGNYGHAIIMGRGSGSTYHAMNYGIVISTEDAWNLDTKMDDGLPGTGTVTSTEAGNPSGSTWGASLCANNADPALAEYDLSLGSASRCSLIFKMGF